MNIKLLPLLLVFASCKTSQPISPKYKPADTALYHTIVAQDSIFFDAYNHCKTSVMESMLATDIEFYHDQGGLSTSKPGLLEALQKNICGKVNRELRPGSIEVYAIPGYGAIEMGWHGFINFEEKMTRPGHYSKFVHTWRLRDGKWELTRVISLH